MSATARQKACTACAEAKRKCDRQIPACKRCVDQDLDCEYPQRKRRRLSRPVPGSGDGVPAVTVEDSANHTPDDQPEPERDLPWSAAAQTYLDAAFSDWAVPSLPLPLAGANTVRGTRIVNATENSVPPPKLWFLREDTWMMHQTDQLTACMIATDLQPFMDDVRQELECWVRTTRCNFVHNRLYEYGMPACVQDAFTTLATYVAAEEKVAKQLVLQISEERACALVQQMEVEGTGGTGLQTHLARVQALFVHEFIRLFDGSVRLRASAEKQLPVLRQWLDQMWEAAKQYRGEDVSSIHGDMHWTSAATSFDRDYYSSSTVWRSWILTESVRRTHLIVNFVANTYRCMTEGFAPCEGAAMVTVNRGLWDADSTHEWTRLIEEKPPLLVPALQPGYWMSEYGASDVDDLAHKYWAMVVGSDKMRSWIEKEGQAGVD